MVKYLYCNRKNALLMFNKTVTYVTFVLSLASPAMGQGERYECLVQPAEVVRVGAPVNGIVARVEVDRGDWVEQGQEIAQLDVTLQDMAIRSAELKAAGTAELAAAEARVVYLRARLDRNEQLKDYKVVAVSAVEEMRAELDVAENDVLKALQNQQTAKVELEAALAERERRIVRSPLAGYVLERGLSVGEYWKEDTPLVTIAAIDQLHVEAVVGIEVFGRLELGDTAMVVPEASGGRSYAATISVIDRVFDAASGTFGVRLTLPNPDRAIPAGQRCEVTFGAD